MHLDAIGPDQRSSPEHTDNRADAERAIRRDLRCRPIDKVRCHHAHLYRS